MRIVKEAEERKSEILDAAEELFAAKGYEQTSTGDILERVGIARGTLYYHFKSKEDILDALIECTYRADQWGADCGCEKGGGGSAYSCCGKDHPHHHEYEGGLRGRYDRS